MLSCHSRRHIMYRVDLLLRSVSVYSPFHGSHTSITSVLPPKYPRINIKPPFPPTDLTMRLASLILSGFSLGFVASASQVFVDNKCNFKLYLQSKQGDSSTGVIVLPANKQTVFSATIPGPNVKQSSLTISRQLDLSSPLQAVYNQGTNPARTYYDLSTIFGDPLKKEGFELLAGSVSNGYSVSCPPRNSGDCPNTWSSSNPGGQYAVFNQGIDANLILQLCSSNGNSS
jgi:hypothetical protein